MDAKHSQSDYFLETLNSLWDEYKYRHDLIWQRTFTFTTAITLISIIPYMQENVACLLANWIIIAPILALILAGFGLLVMRNELNIFSIIKKEYRRQQNLRFHNLLEIGCEDQDKKDRGKWLKDKFKWCAQDKFKCFVMAYFVSLVVLSIINIRIVGFIWIPRLLNSPACPCP